MHNLLSPALIIPLLGAAAAASPSISQNRSNIYSCSAFARMSGASLPRNLPCEDGFDNNRYYKSFDLYCEARSLQPDILLLQGCNEKYFDRQRKIYGR